jgi:hypothetical protein
MKKWWIIGVDQAGPYIVGSVNNRIDAETWKKEGYEIRYQYSKPFIF